MHAEAYNAVAERLKGIAPPRSVVEFGSKNVNGSVRPLFSSAVTYVGIDCAPGPDVDIVMDAALFEPVLRPACVVCCEVLEHAENAQDIVTNAVDILEQTGIVIITCASTCRAPHSAVDGGALREGEFYRNVEPDMLRLWLEMAGAVRVEVEHNAECGDAYAVGFKP